MKTFKRELAVILLVWLAYVVEVKDASLVEVLVWPVFTFAALSFGLDWFGKSPSGMQQSSFGPPNRRRTQRSSECASGQDSDADGGDYEGPRPEDK
jgi:hypothetical protein